MKNGKRRSPSPYTIIGPEVFFEGILISKEAIRIDGSFKGRIECKSTLSIGETGKVEGDIVAESLLLAGELVGNAATKKNLEIRQNGKLYGNICTEELVMEPGVVFEGRCTRASSSLDNIPAFPDSAPPRSLTLPALIDTV